MEKVSDGVPSISPTDAQSQEKAALLFGFSPQEHGTPYYSAGGGEVVREGSVTGLVKGFFGFFREEGSRYNDGVTVLVGPDAHSRPPQWIQDKNVAIDGTTLSNAEMRGAPGHWMNKYKKELDIGEALAEVRRQKITEKKHDVLGMWWGLRRRFGFDDSLDDEHARQKVEARYRIQADVLESMQKNNAANPSRTANEQARRGAVPSSEGRGPSGQQQQQQQHATTSLPTGSLLDDEALRAAEDAREKRSLGTAWKVLMESVETGRPLVKVAREYRPQVDFYGIDSFLDSAPSLIWFSTKCGIAIGLLQGTTRAMQAINVDVQFLKASGVGVLSILNMSVFASIVKWGGNTAVFGAAFCIGDRMARALKRRTLPRHDAEQRSTANYVAGLGVSGASVGVLPWWMLSDVTLAARLAVSGAFVGGLLGVVVGMSMQRLVALNVSRLDATDRQLRRYEALLKRQKEWVEREREKERASKAVWW